MIVRFANEHEIKKWNSLILANPDGGNIFSSYEYAMQKETGGYKAYFILVDDLAVTVLEKNVSGLGKLWYLPKGPNITSSKELLEALESLGQFGKKHGVFTIRIESEINRNEKSFLEKKGLIKARPIVPNPSTITLDISDDIEKILLDLPQKGRYAIRRAERDGVIIKQVESNEDNCKLMYNLLSETAEGQFGIRNYSYFKTFWKRFEKAGLGQLFFAYHENRLVAGAYAMSFGQKSTYKDGASVRKRTVYGASHLLQWKIIEWAKTRGVVLHDLCGSPPSEEINNTQHKHYGVGLFKTGFSKSVTDYIGCYDFIINQTKYKLWVKIGEKIVHRIHYYKHHDSYF